MLFSKAPRERCVLIATKSARAGLPQTISAPQQGMRMAAAVQPCRRSRNGPICHLEIGSSGKCWLMLDRDTDRRKTAI